MLILIAIYFLIGRKKKEKAVADLLIDESNFESKENESKSSEGFGKFQGVLTQESIYDFLELEKIEHNMLWYFNVMV